MNAEGKIRSRIVAARTLSHSLINTTENVVVAGLTHKVETALSGVVKSLATRESKRGVGGTEAVAHDTVGGARHAMVGECGAPCAIE